jgi:hypothetical protein
MNDDIERSLSADPESAAYLERALAKLSKTAGYRLTLGDLLDRWSCLVRAVEEGYGESIYEYANDVAVRNPLRGIEVHAPARVRTTLAASLVPLDDRFFAATDAVTDPITGTSPEPGEPWSRRVPKRPAGDLLDDLRLRGLYR